MGAQGYLLLSLLAFATSVITSTLDETECDVMGLKRCSFDKDFIFGAASSAYQYEGAANEGGRGPSIWDTFTQRYPGKIKNGSNGNVAVDSYHRYKEDVTIMKKIGLNAYRFSISWSRILPRGKLSGGVNQEGIKYYDNLIDDLLANGIKPFVTLFHFDLPQALEHDYGGFLSPEIVNDFRDYVELCFWEFGDRVKHWITLNEPWTYSYGGYAKGFFAPGRCSWQEKGCTGGDSGREPYKVAHYQLLAHAAAVKLYREKYQAFQGGKIGITLVLNWFEPLHQNEEDLEAQQRALDFMLGWFMEPLTTGAYPERMQKNVESSRLPQFNEEEKKMVLGSLDFLGLNYYSADYVTNSPDPGTQNPSYDTDRKVQLKYRDDKDVPIGKKAASDWLHVYPSGIQKLLEYTNRKYKVSEIYITENGIDGPNNGTKTLSEALADTMRIKYHQDHLCFLEQAIESIRNENKDKHKEFNVKGYFVWSLLDNFEWADGYTVRFGMVYIDYNNGLRRYPKDSAVWFRNFLKSPRSCQPRIFDH